MGSSNEILDDKLSNCSHKARDIKFDEKIQKQEQI